MLIQQSPVFTYVGAINSLALGCLFLYLKYSQPKSWHAVLFSFLGLLVLVPIVLISGGINSQFTYLFMAVPIFTALVSNSKYTWIIAIVIILMFVTMLFSIELLPDFTYENVPYSKSASRTLWLSLSVLLITTFGIQFNRINSNLGNKLQAQAEIDQLTGLHNRRSLMNFLKDELEESKRNDGSISVMMIDLDHFKSINDNYGHITGDNCLKMAAQAMQKCVRNDIDLAGRYGGEEFIVVIKNIDNKKVMNIAEQIRGAIEDTSVSVDNAQQIKLTATIGVCTLDSGQLSSIENLLEIADKALYKGKNAGRNRVEMA